MKDTFFDRIALLLWRDRDGYDLASGSVGDSKNVSMATRLRHVRDWFFAGFRAHWKWWVTTLIATSATAAAIIPLYLNLAKTSEQVNPYAAELFGRCIENGKCIIRIEPVTQDKNQVITRGNYQGLNDDRAGKK